MTHESVPSPGDRGDGAPALGTSLLTRLRDEIRRRHYSVRTEQAYAHWVRRFVRFHGLRHPSTLGLEQVRAFLTHLASVGHVSASTQNQALAAIAFLYRDVLNDPLPVIDRIARAKRAKRLPVVMTRAEVREVLAELEGTYRLMAFLLYGSGLRLRERLSLRVKDIDLDSRRVVVRAGKGEKDRVTMLADSAAGMLRDHLRRVRRRHESDLSRGAGTVTLPGALATKYPSAARDWPWQWIFPAARLHRDGRTGERRRHHVHPSALQRAVADAVRRAGVTKRATCHTFRHSFATHLLEDG